MTSEDGNGESKAQELPQNSRQTAKNRVLPSEAMAIAAAYLDDELGPEDLGIHKITVEEWHQMDGAFDQDARLELIDGVIFEMSPIHVPHARAVTALHYQLVPQLQDAATVHVQNPAYVDPYSEPQPDIVVARGHWRDMTHHPAPDEILVAIEVGDSTVRTDRRVKVPLYARAGIAETWLVDVKGRRVEIYRSPVDGKYEDVSVWGAGQVISPAALPDVQIVVDDLWVPAPPDGDEVDDADEATDG